MNHLTNFFVLSLLSGNLVIALAETASNEKSGEERQISQECYIGQYNCYIVPERVRSFSAPVAGLVSHLVDDSQRVKKGEVLAKLNEDDIELERMELDLLLEKEQIEKEEEINKLVREREEFEYILKLPKEDRWKIQSDKTVEERLVKILNTKIDLARRELETSQKKKKTEFEKKEETFYITMPFDGRIQYSLAIKGREEDEAYIDAGKELVSVYDDSAFYVTINISSAEIARIPSDSLKLVVELVSGEKLTGTFAYKRQEKSTSTAGNGEVQAFYFKLDPSQHETADKMKGTNCLAKLYYMAGEDVIFISKMQLANMPEARDSVSWQSLLARVKPDYELIIIGETQIIARKK